MILLLCDKREYKVPYLDLDIEYKIGLFAWKINKQLLWRTVISYLVRNSEILTYENEDSDFTSEIQI